MLSMKSQFLGWGKVLLCVPCVPWTWLFWPKLCRVLITYFYVSLSQEITSLLRISDLSNTGFDIWMNEWMKSTQCIFFFFLPLDGKYSVAKCTLTCLRHSLVKTRYIFQYIQQDGISRDSYASSVLAENRESPRTNVGSPGCWSVLPLMFGQVRCIFQASVLFF